MPRSLSLLVIVAALGVALHAQTPTALKTTIDQLNALKATNAKQLEKQKALLLKLEELQKDAAQIRFLTKRG